MGIWALFVSRYFSHALQKEIQDIQKKYNMNFLEIKWRKLWKKTLDLYKELVDFCIDSELIQFHCIVVNKQDLNLEKYHNNDEELAFYKRYYFLLKNKIKRGFQYNIFLDFKIKKEKSRIKNLKQFLDIDSCPEKDWTFPVRHIGEYNSHDHIFIQLADLFIWAVCYARNEIKTNDNQNNPKQQLISYISQKIRKPNLLFSSSNHQDTKFNIYHIKLKNNV